MKREINGTVGTAPVDKDVPVIDREHREIGTILEDEFWIELNREYCPLRHKKCLGLNYEVLIWLAMYNVETIRLFTPEAVCAFSVKHKKFLSKGKPSGIPFWPTVYLPAKYWSTVEARKFPPMTGQKSANRCKNCPRIDKKGNWKR